MNGVLQPQPSFEPALMDNSSDEAFIIRPGAILALGQPLTHLSPLTATADVLTAPCDASLAA